MSEPTKGPRPTSAIELKAQIEAEWAGRPFLVRRGGDGERRIAVLGDEPREVWIGRSGCANVELDWVAEVSAFHARPDVVSSECTLVDDGLSTNGSFVNG
jgi:hypothetical protein